MTTPSTSHIQPRSAPPSGQRALNASEQGNQNAGSPVQQPPQLHPTTRATQHDLDEDEWTPAQLPAHHAHTLRSLRDWLKDFNNLNNLGADCRPDELIQFCNALKAAEKDNILPDAIRNYAEAVELSGFVNALTVFLARFHRALDDAGSPLRGAFAKQPVGQLRTMCLGLSVCANPLAAMPFSTKQRKEASAALQGITNVLMDLVGEAGLPDAGKSISVVLDITNLLTRGLKSGLLSASPEICKIAPRFVEAFVTWSAMPASATAPLNTSNEADAALTIGGPPAKAAASLHREPHQIGKCAAQISPLVHFKLLDQAALGALRQLAFNLGSDAMLKHLQTPPMRGVAAINLTNMVKDGIASGLLPIADKRLPGMIEGLLELIVKTPISELVMDGGRTLSNAANFLRELLELEVLALVPAPVCLSTLRHSLEACTKIVGCTKQAAYLGVQTTVNLLSFMKAADKWVSRTETAQSGATNAVAAQALKPAVLAAARKLIDGAIVLKARRFGSQEAMAGLLAALAYFAEREVAMPGGVARFICTLAALIAEVRTADWDRQARGSILQAIDILMEKGILAIGEAQGPMRSLFGPCHNPDGMFTVQDVSTAAGSMGPQRETVLAVPPELALQLETENEQEQLKQAVSALSADPVDPPARPGFTPIRSAPAANEPIAKKSPGRNGKGVSADNASASPSTTANSTTTNLSTAYSSTTYFSNTNSSNTSSTRTASATSSAHRDDFRPANKTARARFGNTSSALVVTAPELVSCAPTATAEVKQKSTPADQNVGAHQPVSQHGKKPAGKHAETPHPKNRRSNTGKTTSAPAAAGSTAESVVTPVGTTGEQVKPAGTTPRLRWFDLVASGGDSLTELESLAEQNPELVNAKDKAGHTAIFYAVTRGKKDVATWLMLHDEHRLEGNQKRYLESLIKAVKSPTDETVDALFTFITFAMKFQYIGILEVTAILARNLTRQPWLRKAIDALASKLQSTPSGSGTGRDVAKVEFSTVEQHVIAAMQGDADAQFLMGSIHNAHGKLQDESEAAAWYRKAADQGHARAQYDLGVMYTNGRGVARDDVKAFEWYGKAAAQGNAEAQFNLAVAYGKGRGVEKDKKKEFEWYGKAAAQGDAAAQFSMGGMYIFGDGVAQDVTAGIEWNRKAAAQGHAPSQFTLGVMCGIGHGVKKDEREAAEWYRKAAVQGDAAAQCKLGFAYETGSGVAKDKKTAVEWYRSAADLGYEQAKVKLKQLLADVHA